MPKIHSRSLFVENRNSTPQTRRSDLTRIARWGRSILVATAAAIVACSNSVADAQTFKVYEAAPKTASHSSATLVFLHGGAWASGDLFQYQNLATAFTQQGVRVVLADYRLSSKAPHPAPIDDLATVLKQIKAERIVLVGHSAGAHMIAFWNSSKADARVRGFIGLEGIYDISNLVKVWPSYRSAFIQAEFGKDETKWPLASPTRLTLKSKSPWLLIHSDADELVDVAQTTDFEKHLRTQGVSVESLKLKTESHFGAVSALENSGSPAFKAALKFIQTVSKP